MVYVVLIVADVCATVTKWCVIFTAQRHTLTRWVHGTMRKPNRKLSASSCLRNWRLY